MIPKKTPNPSQTQTQHEKYSMDPKEKPITFYCSSPQQIKGNPSIAFFINFEKHLNQ